MQIAVILMGCLVGFVGGIVSFTVLDFGLFAALSIWAASGPVTVLAMIALSALRQPQTASVAPAHGTATARAEIA